MQEFGIETDIGGKIAAQQGFRKRFTIVRFYVSRSRMQKNSSLKQTGSKDVPQAM
jgi:hypothetical protein